MGGLEGGCLDNTSATVGKRDCRVAGWTWIYWWEEEYMDE